MKSSEKSSFNTIQSWRIGVFFIGFAGVMLIFAIRLFNLQILQDENWKSQSLDNRTEYISLPARRGVIYDRNNENSWITY